MKSLNLLLQYVLADASTWCCTCALRDYKVISQRIEDEGLSFLTITLPTYCSDFERALDSGAVDHTMFLSFKKRGGLPLLLGGFLDLVFDRASGRLLDVPSKDAIFFIRQITLMFKKILLPCSEERERSAFDGYVKCELEVSAWEDGIISEGNQLLGPFADVSNLLWAHDLSFIDLMVYELNHVPKHGPGATADKLFGNSKYQLGTWTERLEEFFPAAEFVIPNWGYYNELESVNFDEPGNERPVRVISVPKTLKTPRIIAIEPTCMQYAQQSLMEIFVDRFERSNYLNGMIGFTDQRPNQVFARLGSEGKGLATLDLSEASDRVSNLLVKRLLQNFPTLSGAVQACRSTTADVPEYGVIPISKFASMGSAVCFPVEAMVFLTIVFCGIQNQLNRPLTMKDIKSLSSRVRVYGDDIIVPVEYVRSVVSALHDFGLVVNRKKSFWTGKFRESCGRDYYDGADVTVVYCRNLLPKQRSDVSEMVSCISLRNQLYKAGLWKSAGYLDSLVQRLAPFPNVLETSPVLGRHTFLGFSTEKMCPDLHRPLVKGYVVVPKPRPSKLDGYGALLKHFLKRGVDPFFDAKHLERYGRPESVDIKIRWASAV
jgi:hypothetical protein